MDRNVNYLIIILNNNNNNKFKHDNPYTVGIEEEYMICDPESGDLINRANEIMDELDASLIERYSYELILSEIEVNTSVCNNVKDAMEEIAFLRNNTSGLGRKLGFKLGISGTHPTALSDNQSFVDNESYKWVANQLSYYAKRNITFALHVHIAVPNEEYAIHVSNALRRWISPLLALSCNSPFFEGKKTGLRSSRTMQFGAFPRTNIPKKFNSFSEYEVLVKKLIEINSIEKARQIWWKIRPHMDFGTIEFRMCDMQRSLKNVEMIASLCQALVYQGVKDYDSGKLIESFNMEYLNDALWKASRFPMGSKIIDPINENSSTILQQINQMKDYVNNSLDFFNNSHVNKQIDYIVENGTEHDMQIQVYDECGMQVLKKYLMEDIEYNN